MAEPFLGEIRMMSFNFPPAGWAFCNGQVLPINQNQALFALLGTTYGGTGSSTFALPDLRGKVPIHAGQGHTLGETGGEENHTLTNAEMPQHIHLLGVTQSPATGSQPGATSVLAAARGAKTFGPLAAPAALHPGAVSSVGGSQPHNNMAPYLTINFCIALTGIFPSQN